MARTKDSRKLSFYKMRRKRGLTNEEIRPLWEKRKVELDAKPATV